MPNAPISEIATLFFFLQEENNFDQVLPSNESRNDEVQTKDFSTMEYIFFFIRSLEEPNVIVCWSYIGRSLKSAPENATS